MGNQEIKVSNSEVGAKHSKDLEKNWFKVTTKRFARLFKNGKESKLHSFLSKFSKAILTMIAVLPAAGLIITLGKLIGPLGLGQIEATSKVFNQIGSIVETIGWVPFTHMGLLFAIAIGGSWSKNHAGGAFAGALAYFVLLAVGSTFFITRDITEIQTTINADGEKVQTVITTGKEFMNYIMGGKWTSTEGYFNPQEGVASIRFDALGGIVMGFVGASIYNKYYTFNKLPNALAFFNGPRFVPFMVFLIVLPIAAGMTLLWPLVQSGINWVGVEIAQNNTVPFVMPFTYGFLERILLPFGLHHMLTIPMNYTSFGGELNYLDPTQYIEAIKAAGLEGKVTGDDFVKFFSSIQGTDLDALKAQGQEYMWFTWITALGNVKNNWTQSGNAAITPEQAYSLILDTFEPVRFKAGQMVSSTGSLVGAGLGMMYAIEKSARNEYKSIYISGALACLLTGVTEPIEFIFMFTAPLLYVGHAVLTGIAFGMVDFIPMRIHAFGGIETIVKYFGIAGPTSMTGVGIRGNFWLDGLFFALTSAGFGTIYFFMFKYFTKWMKPSIPGFDQEPEVGDTKIVEVKKETKTKDGKVKVKKADKDAENVETIIELLGGLDNLKDVDACMTRLRVQVKDQSKVVNEFKQRTAAIGVLEKGESLQVVYGGKAGYYKEAILRKIEEQGE
ncbi:PTS transporter subunit EIIC [[Acholeplasma] multilocale]|uniref:PTS transporter subunit EIIC n=1 Tax=[Acholeplasma] multilocale TaxID=264638 RepID=UPI000A06E542|nr:PTS transporter subunit EIIC [[Acholeplasma] multilocale]